MTKSPIDIQRDAAFRIDLPADCGGIKELKVINEHMYAIGANAIYEIILPDSIDPERTNPNVKGINRRILDIGLDSPIVARLLGQTFEFSQIMPQEKLHKITLKAFELIPPMYQMATILISTYNELDEIVTDYNKKNKTEQFVSISQISNLESSVRTFFLEAHKVLKSILELLNMTSGGEKTKNFTELAKDSNDSNVISIINGYYASTLDVIWNLRNSIEHPSPNRFVKINNVTISANNKITEPTWEHAYESWDNKKVVKTDKAYSLIGDMDVLFTNMQRLIEDTLLCVSLSVAYCIISFEIEVNEKDETKPRYSIKYCLRQS